MLSCGGGKGNSFDCLAVPLDDFGNKPHMISVNFLSMLIVNWGGRVIKEAYLLISF